MKKQLAATKPDADTSESKLSALPPPAELQGFIDTDTVLRLIPVSAGTLRNWRLAGKIPWINAKGRRVLFHWPSVREALLRNQSGGAQ